MSNNDTALQARLRHAAEAFPYPPTPDVAGQVAQRLSGRARDKRPLSLRRMAIALAALLLLVMGLLAVPPVRASILEFLQVGSVRIWLVEPTAIPTVSPTAAPTTTPAATPAPGANESGRATATRTTTPPPTETPLTSLHSLGGETTLEEARARSTFPIRLPTYPVGLGEPDRVYRQYIPALTIVLVWLDETGPAEPGGAEADEPEMDETATKTATEKVVMSLHILTEGAIAHKTVPSSLEETTVHGEGALWTTGPYWLQVGRSSLATFRLIQGHTLIWAEGPLTYRLETTLPLEEAVRVAESLE